jgi:hypothetical protein
VSNEGQINSLDAGIIQTYFVSYATSPAEIINKPWEFWNAGDLVNTQGHPNTAITVNIPASSTGVERNFFGLASGDFNRSLVPTTLNSASASETLTLLHGEDVPVLPFTTVDVPITAVNAMEVGAISLILSYPDGKLEVENVFL